MMIETFVKLAPSKNKSAVLKVATRLQARYGESQRKHHTWEHLEHGLAEYRAVSDAPLGTINFFAWAYHDSFYVPTAPDNEEKSAILFLKDFEALGFDVEQADEVVELIRLTEPTRVGTSVVNDMDLCILGTDLKTYFQYVSNVREEYRFLSDESWRAGRTEVLHGFLERVRKGTLFNTMGFAAKFTHLAGRNMAAELEVILTSKEPLCGSGTH